MNCGCQVRRHVIDAEAKSCVHWATPSVGSSFLSEALVG